MITQYLRNRLSKEAIQMLSVFSGLLLLMIVFSISSPYFFTKNNLLSVALQTSIIVIIAMGQTFVLITAGIDLSIGSNIALAGITSSMAMLAGIPVSVAVVIGLFSGTLVGLLNGVLIVYGKLPPFIVTLGSMSIIRGVSLVLTGGIPVSGLPKAFKFIGSGKLLGIPVAVLIMITLALIFGFVLSKTKLGRYIYATGSNYEATKLSGVNTKMVIISVYVISGFLSACAGVILAARIASGQPTAGTGYELDAVASSVIGGTSLSGGEGIISGTFIGAFVIGVLRNGLNLLNISAFWQQIVIGVVIICAVFIDRFRNK